jgi:phosphoserine phosphatase
MRLQLDQLAFELSPEELRSLVPDEIDGVRELADGTPLKAARDDAVDALAARDHAAFRAKLAWLYAELDETEGIGAAFAYPFLCRWVAGHTPTEVRALAAEAMRVARDEPFGQGTWTSPAGGRIGARTASFETGIAPQVEMVDLYRALIAAGVEVHIVSASQQYVVEGARAALGYPEEGVQVWGMRLVEEEGRLTSRMRDAADYPVTWRAGKRTLIERHIGCAPVLVGGDSDTDFEMMTGFEETEIRLLINRNPSPDTSVHALLEDERTLVQGRDEPAGRFHAARETRGIDAPVD